MKSRDGKSNFVMIILFILLLSTFAALSTAIIKKEAYELNQDIKLDLSVYESYTLKIMTPSRTLLREGSRDIFLFNLNELGYYEFELKSKENSFKYKIKVLKNLSMPFEQSNLLSVVNVTEEINKLNSTKKIDKFVEKPLKIIGEIRAGEVVKWRYKLNSSNLTESTIKIPYDAKNLKVIENNNAKNFTIENSIKNKVLNLLFTENTKELLIKNITKNTEIFYETPAPKKTEKNISKNAKEVIVSAPDYLNYTNVIATTRLSKPIESRDGIRVYWKEEKKYLNFKIESVNSDGFIEEIEWVVPHLSTQTFEIILITKAEHLDSNRTFIEDVYDNVSEIDNRNISISEGEYVRVTFEKLLDSSKDITIYAKSENGVNGSIVEVYEKDKNVLIETFELIEDYKKYQIFLLNLIGTQDTFDLLIKTGKVIFDYIIDPSFSSKYFTGFETGLDGWSDPGNDVTRNQDRSYCTDSTCTGDGAWTLEIKDNAANSYSQQTFDLSNFCNGKSCDYVMLSFWAYYEAALDSGEELDVKCDGTTIWSCYPEDNNDPIDDSSQCSGTDNEDIWKFHTVNLSDPEFGSCTIDSSVVIRFESEFSANNEESWIDGINITGYGNYLHDPLPMINTSSGINVSNQDLNCFDILIDQDNEDMNVTVRWYLDDILNRTLNYNNNYANNTNFNSKLLSENTSEGDDWKCSIQVTDGYDTSSWINSSLLSIVDPGIPIEIIIVSPLDASYSDSNMDFNVTINKDTSWCTYSLDGNNNISMTKINDTFFSSSKLITGGVHDVEIFCEDSFGYVDNENVSFLANIPQYDLIGEWGIVKDIPTSTWNDVSFEKSFDSIPIVVHQIDYGYDYDNNPCTTRIRAVTKSGFQIRTDSWSESLSCPSIGIDGYWLAVIQGVHNVSNGGTITREIEASNFTMDVDACGSGANPTDWTYAENHRQFKNSWDYQPLVLASVQTANDVDPISQYLRGCTNTNADTWNTTCIEIGLNGMENDGAIQPCNLHTQNEIGGYIAWEMDSSWSNSERMDNNGSTGDGITTYSWEAYWESDSVRGSQNDPYPMSDYLITLSKSYDEGVAFGSGIRVDGANGVFPTIHFEAPSDKIYLLSDEDEFGDVEQSHTPEPYEILFFSSFSGFLYSEVELPKMTIISPINDTTYGSSTIALEVSTLIDSDSCWFSLDSGTNATMNKINTTFFDYTQTGLSDATHDVVFYCNDTYGGISSSEEVVFYVDATPLIISSISPLSQSYANSSLEFSVNTNKPVDECSYSLNSGTNISMNKINSTYFNITKDYLREGNHNIDYYCRLGSSTNFTSTSFSVDLNIIENVSHGSALLPDGSNEINISFDMQDLSKAFLMFSIRSGSSGPSQIQILGELMENKINFRRYSTSGDVTIEWTIIESSDLYVQRGNREYGGTSASEIISIDSTNLSSTFNLISNRLDSGTTSENVQGFWSAKFDSPTQLSSSRGTTGSSGEFHWQSVEWIGANVQYGSFSGTGTSTSKALDSNVNISRSFLLFSRSIAGETSLQESFIEGYFNGPDSIEFSKTGSGAAYDISWFVVENDRFTVQNGTETISGASVINVDINAIKLNESFSLKSHTSTGGGTTFANAFLINKLINTTSIQFQKGTGAQTQESSWFVISLGESPVEFINVISPLDRSYSSTSLDFNVSLSDLGDWCGYSLDDGINMTLNKLNSTYFYGNEASLITGEHNVTFYCNNTSGEMYKSNNIVFEIDVSAPIVVSISPPNQTVNHTNTLYFEYNVTDNFGIDHCDFIIDEEIIYSDNSIIMDTTQFFEPYVDNGVYAWYINCSDDGGLRSSSEKRIINVSGSEVYNWANRFYETSTTNFTGASSIGFNSSRDSLENQMSITLPASQVTTVTIAKSPYFGNGGVIIPSSTIIDFSAYTTVARNNYGYLTWKLYVENSSGDMLICQSGDDFTSGTRISSPSGTWAGTCTSPSSDLILKKSDRLKMVLNIYNSDSTTLDFTHSWDDLRLSYVEFMDFTVLGALDVTLMQPSTDKILNSGDKLTMSCEVDCSVGTCSNTKIYAQYYDFSSGWKNIESSGNLILDSGESNPHNLGDISPGVITENFTIQANFEFDTSIRCSAVGSYDSDNSSSVGINISEYPQIFFTGLTPTNDSNLLNDFFRINISINDSSLNEFVFNFDGKNYTFLKDKLDMYYSGISTSDLINVSNLKYGNDLVVYPDKSLKLLWTFNNDSKFGEESSDIVDLAEYDNNGTIVGAAINIEGRYDNAINFSGSDYVRATSFPGIQGENQATISTWVKQDINSQDQYLLWADGNVLIQFGDSYSNPGANNLRLRWNLDGTWRNSHSVAGVLDSNLWNNWIFVFDNGNTSIYKNGLSVYNGTDTQTSISSINSDYDLGYRSGTNGLRGSVDEFMIWDRALTSSEISSIGKSDLKKNDSGLWSFALNVTTLPDGDYNYYGFAKNNKGNINKTEVRYITVNASETTPPVISIIEPSSNAYYNVSSVDFNVSLDKSGAWCGYSIDGGTNVTMNAINSTYYSLMSNIPDGHHSVIFYCNSSFGVFGSSESRMFDVDATDPAILFVLPTPDNLATRIVNNTFINITIDEKNLKNFDLEFNNLNNSFYSSNLVLMMSLNNNSNIGDSAINIHDSSPYSNDGSFNGDANWDASGKYSSAISFDGTNDWISVDDDSSLEGMEQFSFEAWIYDTANDAQPRGIASKRDGSSSTSFSIFLYSGRYIYFDVGGSADRHNSGIAIDANKWNHIVVTFNGSAPSDSRKKFYVNGEIVATTASSQTIIPGSSADLTLGILNANYGNSWQGRLDEIKIYNETLDDTEIKKHYESNFHQTDQDSWNLFSNITNLIDGTYNYSAYGEDKGSRSSSVSRVVTIAASATPPIININLPLNNTQYSTSDINFNFTVIDKYDSSLICNLTLGNILDVGFSVTNNTLTNRLISGIPDGFYDWNVTCENSAFATSSSETRRIEIRSPPTVSFVTQNNSWFYPDFEFEFIPTDNTNFSNCSLYIDGTFNRTNSTTVTNGVPNIITVDDLNDGEYNWTIICTDLYGLNSDPVDTLISYRDGIPPEMSLTYPLDGQKVYSSTINFNLTAEDILADIITCNLTVDGNVVDSNFNFTNGTHINRSNVISPGTHNWNVTCWDIIGNYGTSQTWNFTNYNAPGVTLDQPENNSWINNVVLSLNYSVLDGDDNLDNCSLYFDGLLDQTDHSPNNGNINSFYKTSSQGYHNWSVSCIDLGGLRGDSELYYVNIDIDSPTILLSSPDDNEIFSWNEIEFNFTATDNFDENMNCSLIIDNFPEVNNINALNNTKITEIVQRGDGNYLWYISCVDDAKNIFNTSIRNVSVVAPPTVILNLPENNNFTKSSSITYNYTPKDAIGLVSCSLYSDGDLNQTDIDIEKNVPNYFIQTGISESNHNWSVRCVDSDSNIGIGGPYNFTRDITSPAIILYTPSANELLDVNGGNPSFTWNVEDNLDSLVTCNLYVDSIREKSNLLITSGLNQTESVSGLSIGEHNWSVECWDGADNLNISEVRNFTYEEPDFLISHIEVNNSTPVEGESVLVNATIENIGLADSKNFVIDFYLGHPSTGIKYGTSIIDLAVGESINVSNSTEVDIGVNELYVVIDYLDAFTEKNETNNELYVNVSVGSWQYFYGDIESSVNYTLNDGNDSLVNWGANSFSSGNIFVSDKESYVSWGDLIALGKDIFGADKLNDFSEIDSLLGMAGFADSISNLYLSGGTPNNITSYLIFGNTIDNVSIANSTDNENFMTGILWDSSDDSDSEFDSIEKEDLIFLTKINKDSVGSYGIYDYEIRVPAKLREYSGAESEVVFYLEIN